ncbi:MAG: hypothetical protein KTR32_04835 [Granulosicoccus sp.]|nr:hypothetical protein [Granulosicoccus sp.]
MNIPKIIQVISIADFTRLLFRALLPAGLIYVAITGLMLLTGFDMDQILRDPAQYHQESSLIGLVSNLGVWFWVASATLALFGAMAIRRTNSVDDGNLFLLLGVLSLLLAIDDLYMIHDRFIDERICYAVYALILIAALVRHHREILQVNPTAFLAAGTLMGLSLFTDLVQNYIPVGYWTTQAFEEGFKFCGGAAWLYFIVQLVSSLYPDPQEGYQGSV